jgi:transcriptional regulator GlxA family with amidase domain
LKEQYEKHLTIIVPDGDNNVSSITGAYEIFKKANEYWKERHKKELFIIQLAGISKKVEYSEGLFTVKPHTNISAITKSNLIVIPSLNHNYQKSVKGNKALIEWVAKQYKDGAEIATICTGAFLLASSGLLDGKSCSTHWSCKLPRK